MTEQTKTPQETYSRDGIMIYQNGFRIAECENEEAAENILNHLQSPQEVKIKYEGTDMLNLKEAFEAAREVRNQLWWDLKYPTFEDYINSNRNK